MTEQIIIKNDLPLPNRANNRFLPLDQLEVGDYFELDISNQRIPSLRQRLWRYNRDNPPVKLSLNKVSDTKVRVFRIEDQK